MNILPCQKHNDFEIIFVYIGQEKIDLLCEYCLDDFALEEINFDITQLIHIQKAMKEPRQILSKLKLDATIKQYFKDLQKNQQPQIIDQINHLQKSIAYIQEELLRILKQLELFVKKMQELKNVLEEETAKLLQVDKFSEIFKGLKKQVIGKNYEGYEQIKNDLSNYFQNFSAPNTKEIQINLYEKIYKIEAQVEIQENLINHVGLKKTLNNLLDDLQHVIRLSYPKIHRLSLPNSRILDTIFFQRIIDTIKCKSKQEIAELNLIYYGQKEQLTIQSFWENIDQKSNCLMILKSNCNYVFGGFTPCKWDKNSNLFVQDDSLISFLFSQTHNEIYPIIEEKKQYAIYCRSDIGPTFGGGHDLQITHLGGGYSQLGHTYKANIPKKNASSHLAGSSPPYVTEFEIFQVIFNQ